MGHYNSFVIRLWTDDNGRLHGTVQHVASGKSLAFLDLAAIAPFIEGRLAPESNEIMSIGMAVPPADGAEQDHAPIHTPFNPDEQTTLREGDEDGTKAQGQENRHSHGE